MLPLKVAPEVANALQRGIPVVALESTIISHGMPYPQNVETAMRVEQTVREGGCIPATIAVMDGECMVGLSPENLELLGKGGKSVRKLSRRDLALCLADRAMGATTVATTMMIAAAAGISVFVTGGIGGVHRDFVDSHDISADLMELAQTPVVVVCAGVKSILDIRKTLEVLETNGVPVYTHEAEDFPAFFSASSGIKTPGLVTNGPMSIPRLVDCFQVQRRSKLQQGIVYAVPPRFDHPNQAKIAAKVENAIQRALIQAQQQHIAGAALTPFLLEYINQQTQGASLALNIELVLNNARVGSAIARQVSGTTLSQRTVPSLSQPACAVIGACALDIIVRTETEMRQIDSNLSRLQTQVGGVACNIARHLQGELSPGWPLHFLSFLGDCSDPFSLHVAETLRQRHGRMGEKGKNKGTGDAAAAANEDDGIVFVPGGRVPLYIGIHGPNSPAIQVGFSDFSLLQSLPPFSWPPSLQGARLAQLALCVLDANLPAAMLQSIGQDLLSVGENLVSVWADPTSCEKCGRLVGALPYLSLIAPNDNEWAVLQGELEKYPQLWVLRKRGALGVELYRGQDKFHRKWPSPFHKGSTSNYQSFNGAGDILLAGMAASYLRRNSRSGLRDSAEAASCVEEGLRLMYASIAAEKATSKM
jgi:pseudouridylate synthase